MILTNYEMGDFRYSLMSGELDMALSTVLQLLAEYFVHKITEKGMSTDCILFCKGI